MQERRWLLAASVILLLGLGLTFAAELPALRDTRTGLKHGAVVDLGTVESSRALLPVFAAIYPDPADRRLAAEHLYIHIVRARHGRVLPLPLRNVGQLNTAALAVPVRRAEAGGAAFRERLAQARAEHGMEVTHVSLLGGASDLRAVKPKLIARSPETYAWLFGGLTLLYFAGFYGLHLYWCRCRFAGDPVLLPVVHLLTGLGLVLMFGLPDPLRDTVLAQGFVAGVLAGCGLMGLASRMDFQHRLWRRQTGLWLLLGIGTAAGLYVAGSGPTGSDARVNLLLPVVGSVQPVELIKLFLVLFLAGFFARRWAFLRGLQQRAGLPRLLHRLDLPRYRDLVPAAVGVGMALGTFYLLRDMGPALVVACTFLALYGIARHRWPAVAAGFAAIAGMFAYVYRDRSVPMVADRIAMLLSPWENFATGGEHLAHAYWAMAAGGVAGQGFGAGSPAYVPAAHTDMVLAALAEEAGLLGLLAVAVLYGVLLHRAFHIALRASGTYSLFLCLGIGLLLLFQIVLIAGGVLGLLPLSGVVTPFLSFGKSSMAVNGLLVGMLMSVSAREGDDVQVVAQMQDFRQPVRCVSAVAVLLAGVFLVKAAYVQLVSAEAWTIRPALVVRGSGERAFTYNPRLYDARRRIPRGTIYDRNGIPLATSRWEEVESFRATYDTLGADVAVLDRQDVRYYPFGSLTFYLLGDVRTRVKWGAGNSLYAEHAYLSHLRGYDNLPESVEKPQTEGGPVAAVVRYNYAELAALVRFGSDSPRVRALLRRDRDLYLTVDVRLQQRVARILAERVPEGRTASVVVLDAATGDVLASVTHPLPEAAFADPTAAHRNADLFDRGFGQGAKPPGSTFKLVTAMAALNRDSLAATRVYRVRAGDRYARRGEPTGWVGMQRALMASSNVYFAALAKEVAGADALLQLVDAFGFTIGHPGLDLRQRRALLEAPDNLRQVGFGQGPLVGSPLQVARVAAAIANDGRLPAVQWVRGPAATRQPPQQVTSPAHARRLGRYLRDVVAGREGTARQLRVCPVPIAGKTGTAEERKAVLQNGRRVVQMVDHAWFTGFAPYTAPDAVPAPWRIAFAVLVEEGGHGGRVAAPIAGAVVEAAADLGIISSPSPRP